jgi:pimeloyl-ACP methyl ester carboxylesterase
MCPPPWHDVLARHKLIWIGANHAGNERHSDHRVRLAVEAAVQVQKRHKLDPDRVYVAGMSGGGKIAAMCATIYGDVFAGGFSICGATFYMKIPTGLERGKYYPATFPPPVGKVAIKARQQNRHVLLTGTEDFNLNSTRQTYELGYKKDNYRHVTLIVVPDLAHELPPAEWFEKGIEALDAREAR